MNMRFPDKLGVVLILRQLNVRCFPLFAAPTSPRTECEMEEFRHGMGLSVFGFTGQLYRAYKFIFAELFA